jgi:hypothetical protein
MVARDVVVREFEAKKPTQRTHAEAAGDDGVAAVQQQWVGGGRLCAEAVRLGD